MKFYIFKALMLTTQHFFTFQFATKPHSDLGEVSFSIYFTILGLSADNSEAPEMPFPLLSNIHNPGEQLLTKHSLSIQSTSSGQLLEFCRSFHLLKCK